MANGIVRGAIEGDQRSRIRIKKASSNNDEAQNLTLLFTLLEEFVDA